MKLMDVLTESMADGKAFQAFVDQAVAKKETQTNESEEPEDEKNLNICPICKKEAIVSCRCSSKVKHTLEDLKKGHGFGCENGHRWSRQTEDGKVITMDTKNK